MTAITGESCVPVGDLTRVGDVLQSAAARLATYLHRDEALYLQLPYEEQMAVLEINRSESDWTAVRRTMKPSSTTPQAPGAGGDNDKEK